MGTSETKETVSAAQPEETSSNGTSAEQVTAEQGTTVDGATADSGAEDGVAEGGVRTDSTDEQVAAGTATVDVAAESAAGTGEVSTDGDAGSVGGVADGDEPVETPPSGVLSGAAAVVSAGLALVSLNGTWLGTQLADRQQLVGQIKAQSGASGNPLVDVYTSPWHTTALANGLFALVAVLVGVGVLLVPQLAGRRLGVTWIRAVAVAAVVLGVIGVLIALSMWFDLFTNLPPIPTRSAG